MRLVTLLAAAIFALNATAASTYAQGRGNGHAKQSTASAPKGKAETHVTKVETRTAKNTAKADKRTIKTTTKTEAGATKVETHAARTNPNQEARLLRMLPAGSNITDASRGFKNWGQFVAAVNASNNHNISFVELKARMTGIPPGGTVPTMAPMSLGQALQSFKVTTP